MAVACLAAATVGGGSDGAGVIDRRRPPCTLCFGPCCLYTLSPPGAPPATVDSQKCATRPANAALRSPMCTRRHAGRWPRARSSTTDHAT